MARRSPARSPEADYRARAERELVGISAAILASGNPPPSGDPLLGIFVLLGQPVGPRPLEALSLSLHAVGIPDAYVTFTATDQLSRELRLIEPHLLLAVGPDAAREIDDLQHPLRLKDFRDAAPGSPFAWKRNTTGLLLPPLHPALDDDTEKRRFWNAFKTLKSLL